MCSLRDRGSLAGRNQTLVTMLKHQTGGSCDLWGQPREPGAHYQHCLSVIEFHQPGQRRMNGSEGCWRNPSWGGTRHWIDPSMLNNKPTLIIINSNIECISIKSRNGRSDLVSYELSDPDCTSFDVQMLSIPQTLNFPLFPYPRALVIMTLMMTIIIIIFNIY